MGSSLISWSRFLCLYLEIITGSPSRQWALPPRLSPSPPCTACISRLFRDATLLRVCDGQENRWRSPYARVLCSHGVPTKSIRFPRSAAVESPAALFGFYSVCNYILQRVFIWLLSHHYMLTPGPTEQYSHFTGRKTLRECLV